MYDFMTIMKLTPQTGDQFRPWIAAIILIVSVLVLVGLFVFSRKDKEDEPEQTDSYDEEDI
jgi:LPXTG-motif cell wall-anchored protein